MLDVPRAAEADVYDEFFDGATTPRPPYARLAETLRSLAPSELVGGVRAINAALLRRGVTFTVYAEAAGTERIFPFDPIPRIFTAAQWRRLADGVAQRVRALNAFIRDVYHEGRILRDGRVPRETVYSSSLYVREMIGVSVPHDVYIHVSGIDVIFDDAGHPMVLEDNVRTPSGISYVLENRDVLKRTFPRLFEGYRVRPVDDYPLRLLHALQDAAPPRVERPHIIVLTPGVYNSAYYEHAMLARQMGVPLVEGRDLVVVDNAVYLKTTRGLERVDVIYRRIDDDFLDPLYFRADSILGVPGLMDAYRGGNVTLANAIGTGVADDKAMYRFVPAMIRYYLSEDPLLDNVETLDCTDERARRHVTAQLERFVVKRTNGSGGYGMLIGPASTAAEREEFARMIEADPRSYIAQPVVQLSSHPTLVERDLLPRRIDLRPFVLYGRTVDVPPAALTRVALREGSLVVNSSQGGGSKDTWVLDG
ncbi:MAG TPA: circularly permuted type 2 ATP-grasp protein [Candidatus Baltobacteraceae bacterium]|nr:circularly permuted type 2 ATP-grasp protein [Candidatus Baltobacteraceae bacterium]